MLFVVARVVGISAVTLYLLSFQLKRRRHIVFTTCISNFLYVLQYVLLGAFSGAVLDVLSTVCSLFAGKKDAPGLRQYAGRIGAALLLLMVGVGLFLAAAQRRWIELLPIAGATLQTGGLWFSNEQTIRKYALAGAPFWLLYNFLSQAYGAAAGSLLTMVSAVIALLRYRKVKTEG